jgi:hypothetical protein
MQFINRWALLWFASVIVAVSMILGFGAQVQAATVTGVFGNKNTDITTLTITGAASGTYKIATGTDLAVQGNQTVYLPSNWPGGLPPHANITCGQIYAAKASFVWLTGGAGKYDTAKLIQLQDPSKHGNSGAGPCLAANFSATSPLYTSFDVKITTASTGGGVTTGGGGGGLVLNGKWINAAEVVLSDGRVFEDGNISDTHTQLFEGDKHNPPDCGSVIDNLTSANTKGRYRAWLGSTDTNAIESSCVGSTVNNAYGPDQVVNLDDTNLSAFKYKWLDANNIATADGAIKWTKSGTSFTNSNCANAITNVSPADPTQRAGGDLSAGNGRPGDRCLVSGKINIAPTNDKDPDVLSLPAASSSNTHDSNATCETGGFGLNWIICPVFNGVANFCDWLFQYLVQPFLVTSPISTDSTDSSFRIWSQFRIYGNVLLVIGLLVLVFGQSIGGGLIDAYTVKKSMPRILIAAILINLSIYIVAGLVDITNVVGGTLGKVMTDPLAGAGAFNFSPSTVQAGNIIGSTGIVTALGVTGGIVGGLASVEVGQFILLFIVMPVVLGLLAAFITLILRKAAILALILVSPVAFALYCLPNTEKYFRKWWDFLVQTLMVYPIVIIIFAVADILSVTVYNANKSQPGAVGGGTIALIIAFLLQFLPLLMIPYAFKLAGGAVGLVHETLTNYHKRGQEMAKGNVNDPSSLRRRVSLGAQNAITASRGNRIASLRERSKLPADTRGGRLRRRATLAQMRVAHFGDNDRARMNQNKIFDEQISDKVGHGADFLERAFFARQWNGQDKTLSNGQTLKSGRYYSTYMGSNGMYGESSAGDVQKSHRLYDGNESKIQTLIKYETGKVPNDQGFYGVDSTGKTIYDPSKIKGSLDREQMPLGSFMSNLPAVMQEAGLNQNSATGAQIGSFFSTQAQRKELKHTKLDGEGGWTQDTNAFVQDWAENFGSYAASTSKTSPIERLRSVHEELRAKQAGGTPLTEVEQRSVKDLNLIAAGLDQRLRAGGIGTVTDDGQPIPAGSQASGRVSDSINKLVEEVLGPAPTGGRRGGPSTPPSSPSDNRGYL